MIQIWIFVLEKSQHLPRLSCCCSLFLCVCSFFDTCTVCSCTLPSFQVFMRGKSSCGSLPERLPAPGCSSTSKSYSSYILVILIVHSVNLLFSTRSIYYMAVRPGRLIPAQLPVRGVFLFFFYWVLLWLFLAFYSLCVKDKNFFSVLPIDFSRSVAPIVTDQLCKHKSVQTWEIRTKDVNVHLI